MPRRSVSTSGTVAGVVVIEQAKGMIAERLDLDVEQAFTALADDVIRGRLSASELA